jgi:acetyl-CoA acetyltransferase
MVSLKFGGLEKKLNFTIETVCFKNKRSWKLEDHCRSTLTLQVGVDPKLMGIGPAFAIPPALRRTEVTKHGWWP